MVKLRVLDLFSGIGGFSLGLERTGGFKTAAFCEIEPFCQKVLRKHWPGVPVYSDVVSFNAQKMRGINVISAGFPCQPFSTASAGRKVARDMWPDALRVIADVSPEVVILENVQERPIRKAQEDLGDGWNFWVDCIGASDCGADHKRSRWWLCAHPYNESEFYRTINAKVAELPKLCDGIWSGENYSRAVRVSHGVPHRVDRLRALGNAVIPQIPEIIGNAILEAEARDG